MIQGLGRAAWSELHDVAMLYLSCMHGADSEIDKSELDLVLNLLGGRANGPKRASEIMDDVLLMYVGNTGPEMLGASIASLAESMNDDQRLDVLQELADIASADGMVYPNEVQFIVQVAKQWGLERFLSA